MADCLGYLITFTCYGTWLHGAKDVSVDRDHNVPGSPFVEQNVWREQQDSSRLQCESVRLEENARSVVDDSVRQVCQYKGWHLHALAVRTNHIHVVVSSLSRPELVMNTLKSYATRALRKKNVFAADRKLWTRHGSTRYLWKEEDLRRATVYVMEGQGEALPGGDPGAQPTS